MSDGLDYIPLFLDFYARYSELTYEERGRLVWAMLAYARGEDPVPHLTEELRRFSFPNERDVIERTRKVRSEKQEKRRAASQIGNATRWRDKSAEAPSNNPNRMQSDEKNPNRMQSDAIGEKSSHNDNDNNNDNHNHNNNHNHNPEGGAIQYGRNKAGRVQPDRPRPIGQERIL